MKDNVTRNGYAFDEVASAFQKTVRRGLVDDALYWAAELYLSGGADFLRRRIMIIACPVLPWTSTPAAAESWDEDSTISSPGAASWLLRRRSPTPFGR